MHGGAVDLSRSAFQRDATLHQAIDPIRDAKGQIGIAISIASAAHCLTDDLRPDLAEQVRRAAEQISGAVGYAAPR